MSAVHHYHILVVDDDSYNRESLESALQKLGFRTDSATNGMHALTKINSGLHIDLIITDLVMPIMNGQQFLKTIHSDTKYKSLPVMLMSASTDKALIMETVEFGITKLFIKPLDYADVAKKVQAFFKELKAEQPTTASSAQASTSGNQDK